MGEFTAHVDTPQGTSFEGTEVIARQVVEEVRGQEGVARVAYLAGADRGNHFHIMFYLQPADERDVSQEVIIARIRGILAAHPGYAPIVTARNPLGGGGGGGGNFAIQASLLGPDITKLYDYSQQLLLGAQQLPSLVDAKSIVQQRQPRGARRGGSGPRRRSRRAHLDHRRRPAADGVGRRRDLDLPGRRRAVPGEDSRAREPAARHRRDRQAHRAVVHRRAGPDRQHRPDGPRLRTDPAAPAEPPVRDRRPGRHRPGPRARRGVERHAPADRRSQHAARLLVPA